MKTALVSTGLLVTILAMPLAANAHDRDRDHFFRVYDRHAHHDCHDRRHGHHPAHRYRHGHGHQHAWKGGHGRPAAWYAYEPHRGYRNGDHRREDRRDWDRRH